MKVAAVDVGSNSIHMVVVEALPGRRLRVLDREKDMVRLGDAAFREGRLSVAAQARALSTIDRFLRRARRLRVDALVCAATSAVRDAANGRPFLDLVRRETGQHVTLLTEQEEARLIYLGVREEMDLRGGTSLVVDVGGGSVELILGDETAMVAAASLPLGVLRLHARFRGARPLPRERRRALREHVRVTIGSIAERARAAGVRRVVGTAGTVNALARVLASGNRAGGGADVPALRRLRAKDLHDLAERLLGMPLSRRRRVPGLDPSRADTLGLGAVVLDELLSAVGAREVLTCKAAVREGLVLDYLATHAERPARREARAVRERSVRDAMERYGGAREHAQHVARLALALFDGTRRLHGLGAGARELLEFGALLHDVGSHVEHRRHHRHGHYLVRHAGLRGFAPEEIELLAVMARYHRRGGPRPGHEEWDALSRRDRGLAHPLIGVLRVADGLDRGHGQEVTGLRVRCTKDAVVVTLSGRRDLTLDAVAARAKADVFEDAFDRSLVIRLEADGGVIGPTR